MVPMSIVFKIGDRGPAVAEIRARLARLSLLPGSQHAASSADSLRFGSPVQEDDPSQWQTTALMSAEYDEDVATAVKEFQAQRGITVDGLVGPETFRRLEEARWRLGDRVLSYAAAHTTVGEDVLELQQRLNSLGFEAGREDGIFGQATDHALRDFQHNTGIAADGVCGPATFKALGQLRRTAGKKSASLVKEKFGLAQLRTGVRGKLLAIDLGSWGTLAPAQEPAAADELLREIAGLIEGRLVALGTRVLVRRPTGAEAVQERAAWANEMAVDLLISLRICNDPDAPAGIATYYFGNQSGAHSHAGQLAASLVAEEITRETTLHDRGSHPRTWDVLRLTAMPAIRVECGNLADENDRQHLNDPVFRGRLAQAFAGAIEGFFAPEHVI